MTFPHWWLATGFVTNRMPYHATFVIDYLQSALTLIKRIEHHLTLAVFCFQAVYANVYRFISVEVGFERLVLELLKRTHCLISYNTTALTELKKRRKQQSMAKCPETSRFSIKQ